MAAKEVYFLILIKKSIYQEQVRKEKILDNKLKNLEHKILLINKNDQDYLDMIYREKFRYGKKNEIVIKLK